MMGILPEGSEIVLSYVSSTWTAERFHRNGGFVAVVLNYNKHGLIGPATQSVLDQDFDCYDIVCLDDNSTDGSEAEMIETLERFVAAEEATLNPKAVRITCVVNSVNQMTSRQWKIAALISDGTWFGMFCGDDISYSGRMQIVSQHLRKHPTVFGVCTNADRSDGERMCQSSAVAVWRGDEINRPFPVIYGCTSFWRREVITKEFGGCVVDDFVLTWSVLITAFGSADEKLLWLMNESTVRYSYGTGVTTSGAEGDDASCWLSKTWKAAAKELAWGRKMGLPVWKVIWDFDCRYGAASVMRDQLLGYYRMGEMQSCDWFGRLRMMWLVFVKERKHLYGGKRPVITKFMRSHFLRFVAGPISFCCWSVLRGACIGEK